MTRNHFSKKGGPYFIGQSFTQHVSKPEDKGLFSVSIIGKVVSLLKSRRIFKNK
jgi:hypothetical protein